MDGSMIRLTVARYYTPTGRLIQKPYEDGYEDYALDLINRYNNGELTTADSIKFPESQKYTTLTMNRTVYGGGGIMPDYFVPLDTTSYSTYYRRLIRTGVLNQFVLQYVDKNRDLFLDQFPDFDQYNSTYSPTAEQLDELIAFANHEEVAFNEDDWSISKEHISLLMKAYFARDLYGTGYFYEVFNPSNEVFNKAVEILENPSLHHQKLAKVEL
jgi:carboxyl-terminal processing protease